MAGLADHMTALVRSHAAGDDESFYSVALQVAAREARQGHRVLAQDIKRAIDDSRATQQPSNLRTLPTFRGDVEQLVDVPKSQAKLRDLVLPSALKRQIEQILAEQRQQKKLADFGFVPAHRLLLEGPPGTGKTMTASVIANELALPIYAVRLDALMSKYMGETAAKLRMVFDHVNEERAVYLFDEIDALGADRTGNDVGEARRVLNSFLIFLENASPYSIVVAATNHRAILDRAIFRRFDAVLTYDLPTGTQGAAVIRRRLGAMVEKNAAVDLRAYTSGLSHADLVRAAESAAKRSIMSGHTLVTREDLISALKERKLNHDE